MWLMPKNESLVHLIKYALDSKLAVSRFTACVTVASLRKTKVGLKIETVRLRNAKDYCGAHPGPCQVTGKKHMKAKYLEGLDWVGFNALLNDLLDATTVNAVVFSFNRESLTPKYYIRRGYFRRVAYPYEYRDRFAHWTQGGDWAFENHCGKPSPKLEDAILTDGTPGYPCYTLEEEAVYRGKEETEHDEENTKTKKSKRARVSPHSTTSPVLVSVS